MQTIRHPVTLGSRVPLCPINYFNHHFICTSFVDFEDPLDPSHDLMGRGIRRLVKVDDSVLLVLLKGSVGGRPPVGERGEVVGLDIKFIVVLLRGGD